MARLRLYFLAPFVLAAFCGAQARADSFTDAIQDLAARTACVGQYSATQAGGGWQDDPHDYYTPQMIASRLAGESGRMTRASTFYGICFDYAQFAWNYVNQHQSWYNAQGLYERQFWIAGVHDDATKIILQYPGTKSNYTTAQNGVYVKIPSAGGTRAAQSHDGATNHAWIWMERQDGVWFWIDPTRTDNAGYVVYGYIAGGKEIQCRPDRDFCAVYPASLERLPLPPALGASKTPSKTSNSKDPEKTINDAGTEWAVALAGAITKNLADYSNPDNWDTHAGFMLSTNVPFSAFSGGSRYIDKVSFGLDAGGMIGRTTGTAGIDYLRNCAGGDNLHGWILNFNFGRRFAERVGYYFGAGGGVRFDFSNKGNKPRGDTWYLANTSNFAFNLDAGLLFSFSYFLAKLELSYDNVTGPAAGFGFGIGL